MSDHAYPHPASAETGDMPQTIAVPARTEARWSGRLAFGGVMMIVVGLFNVILGLVALFDSAYYVLGPRGLLVLDLAGWGWLHLILGALIAVTGCALFTGVAWARVVTVLLAGFNALASLAFLSAYPLWSTIVIVLDVLVIWAVLTSGDEAEA